MFESHDLRLENVIIRAGESAIKGVQQHRAVIAGSRGIILLACAWFRYRPLFLPMSEDVRRYGTPTI